jgi:hypothetical protein
MDKEKKGRTEAEETEETEETEEMQKSFVPDSSCCSDEVNYDDDEDDSAKPEDDAKKRSNYGKFREKQASFEHKMHNSGEKMGDWLKESYEKGKEEILRFTKVARIKLDITALKKKKDERLKLLGKKAIELVKEGFIEVDMIEPEYSMIKSIESEILDKNKDITDIKRKTKDMPAEDEKPAQKVLTAQSIPLGEKEDEDDSDK